MSWRSESIWIEFIMGSRKTSNFCWAFILFLGSLGFLLVGTSSSLGRNFISLFDASQPIISYSISSYFFLVNFIIYYFQNKKDI